MTRDDLLLIVLIGHGTFDGVDAKFNLVGADLESAQWAELLAGLPGRVVVVNTSSASFPFIERLTGDRRVVITATDSVAQRFDTVFPDYFIKAFRERRGGHRQEQPHLDLGGVHRGDGRRAALLPAPRPARHRARAARRQRRRRRP